MNKKLWYIQQLDLFKGLAKDKLQELNPFCNEGILQREVIFEPGIKIKYF